MQHITKIIFQVALFPGNLTFLFPFSHLLLLPRSYTMDRVDQEAIEQKDPQTTKYEHQQHLKDTDDISVIIDTATSKDITNEDTSARHVHFMMPHRYNEHHPTDSSHDENNGTWSNVLLSGLAPLGQQKSPAVCIWILLIMVLVAISGELLWSKETAGKNSPW